jgi:ClpP class serine protease
MTTEFTTQGRNDLCSCGSGKKFKRCHGASGSQPVLIAPPPAPPSVASPHKGQFSEFLGKPVVGADLDIERRSLLAEIGRIRNTEVLAYAGRMQMPVPGSMNLVTYEDILIVQDLINGLRGDRITVLLETPGGFGEVGRQIVEMLHARFSHVEFLVPGWAKSTGTIMVMGGHEILMGPASALGPIDAQLTHDGKTFSADAFIEGFDNIKKEVETTGKLNAAYIPILQKISPGELQHAQNAKDFATITVQEWLTNYKFGNWHQQSGRNSR